MDEFGRDLAEEAGEMVSGPVPSATAELRKRRSIRIVQAVPLVVTGVDALGRPFSERTSTLIINCHGCRYQSKHYVLKNMWVTLEVPNSEETQPARTVRGRIAWIQRPRTVRQLFQVALELELPGNVWGIAFPPEDWFGFPEAERAKTAAAAVGAASPSRPVSEPPQESHVEQQRHAAGSAIDFHIPLSDADAAAPPEQDNIRVFPTPESVTDASLQMARQFARLLAEARQQIQASAREAAAQAVSAEHLTHANQFQEQIAAAREELSRQLTTAIASIQQESVNRSRAAQNAAIEALQSDLPRWLAPQLEELTRNLTAQLTQEGATQRNAQAELSASASEKLEAASRRAEETLTQLTERAQQAEAQLASRAEAANRAMEETARHQQENLAAQQASFDASANGIREQVAGFLASAQANWQTHLAGELEAGQARAQIAIDNAVTAAHAQAAGSLNEQTNVLLQQFQQEVERLAAAFRERATGAASESEQRLANLRESVQHQAERTEVALARAAEVSGRLENFAERIGAAQQNALGDFQAHVDDVLSLHRNELHRRCDSLFEEISERIRKNFEETSRQTSEQFQQQIQSLIQPEVLLAEEAMHRLAGGRALLDAATSLQQDRIRVTADEAFAEALAQFRGNLGSVEQLLRESADAVTARSLADLEGRAESAKHQVVEDLLKSAEWYEKKAQTQIHHFAEKAGEQVTAQLREKAGEISGLFATELNQASRNFVGHAQTQIEEVVSDSFERARSLFSEAAETTTAAFIDEIQRQARQELGGFETEVQKTAQETRTQIDAAHADLTQKVTGEQQDFLLRFRDALHGALETGVAEANQRVQMGFGPLLDSWKSMTEANQQQMRDVYAKAGEHAAEQFRGRLENVSNQWMLATVASLDQQSRDVIASIAAKAEEKLRETCTSVFADVSDVLRERLRQIASNFTLTPPPASR